MGGCHGQSQEGEPEKWFIATPSIFTHMDTWIYLQFYQSTENDPECVGGWVSIARPKRYLLADGQVFVCG